MKYTRLLVGLLVIGVSLWIIAGEQISGTSSNAFVNAQVVTVHSERSGELHLPNRELGSAVTGGESLGQVSDPLVDAVRLNDLEMEKSLKRSQIAALEAQIASGARTRDALEARTVVYRIHRIEEIEIRLNHAQNRLEILESRDSISTTQEQLASISQETPDHLSDDPQPHDLALEHAREHVEVLKTALAAAQAGVFLGDGYNDAPGSEQRAIDLGLELEGQVAALERAQRDLDAIEIRLSLEKGSVNRLRSGVLHAPVSGIYWETLVSDGVTVQRGDPIIRIVDCSTIVVTLSVTEMVYNSLRSGQAATFRFVGDNRVFAGTVSRLGGSGAARIYENLAVAPSAKHLERYDVTVTVPGLANDEETSCAIGRTGRVFFDRRPLDGLRQLFR